MTVIKYFFKKLLAGDFFNFDESKDLFNLIINKEIDPVTTSSILSILNFRGESFEEIYGAASVLKEKAKKIQLEGDLIDTCGTGGDSLQTFNVSTVSAIISSAAGARVAKHGGRSVSSKCGSADVLETLGVNVNLNHEQLGKLVDDIGIGFMFAPNYHPAMKFVAPVRKELAIKTIFNILGPLTNPASAKCQLVGVSDKKLTTVFVKVLQKLGSEHVVAVHGEDGMDEISITGKTFIAELKNNKITEYIIDPSLFGLKKGSLKDIIVQDSEHSKNIILDILDGNHSVARDIAVLNAGAAIYVSGLTKDMGKGILMAKEKIDDGHALNKLNQLIEASNA